MNKSLTPSTAAVDAGQSTPQDLPPSEEAPQPAREHNTVASAASNANPSHDLTPQERMDLLRNLPSFGFEMVGDEPQTKAAEC